jgi:hypothetical protein
MRARTDQESVTALGFWRQNRKHFIFDLFLSKIESSVFATSRTKLAHSGCEAHLSSKTQAGPRISEETQGTRKF